MSDIDAIFDKYDEDGGGTLDEEEAKAMIKGLSEAGHLAEREARLLARDARVARARSTKKARSAMAQVQDSSPLDDHAAFDQDMLGC